MSMLAPTLQAFFSERLIRRTEPIQFGWAVEHPKIIFLVDGHATRLALELTQKRTREHRLSHPRSKREKHKDRHRQQRAQTAQQGAKRREAGGARGSRLAAVRCGDHERAFLVGGCAKIRGMTAKELLLQRAPTLTEEQAQRALLAVEAKPGDIIDDWGNLSAMTRTSSRRALKRMSDEEAAAGFSWEDHLPA